MVVNSTVQQACVIIVPYRFPPFAFSDENLSTADYSLTASSLTEREKKRRALVVDDVLDVTDMLRVLLTHAGFDVSLPTPRQRHSILPESTSLTSSFPILECRA
jgi:hypothetical protein